MHDLYNLKETLIKELEEYGRRGELSKSSLEDVDKLAHAAKNVAKVIECCEGGEYSRAGSHYGGSSYENSMYDRSYEGGMSHRRGRAANGRFVSRDGSEMARRLREMMTEAPDDMSRQEIQRLADRFESM